MLHLTESAHRPRPYRPRWMAASTLTHALVISAATLAGARNVTHTIRSPAADRITYVDAPRVSAPLAPAPSSVLPSPAPLTPPRLSLDLPRVRLPGASPTLQDVTPVPGTHGEFDAPVQISAGIAPAPRRDSGDVFLAAGVDRAVAPLANGQPDYPHMLRAAGVGGDVLVRFVVDTTGRVEPTSVEVVDATHALFAEAVRRWVRGTRYVPASISGTRVRQLVELRVDFTLR